MGEGGDEANGRGRTQDYSPFSLSKEKGGGGGGVHKESVLIM